MRIVGHGIDLVEIPRIRRMLADHGERFLERCFTGAEREYAEPARRREEHLAARFAAKEAVLKALGTGLDDGIAWTEIEVTRDGRGRPGIRLTGRAERLAREKGIDDWLVSLAHTASSAAASVIAVGYGPARLPDAPGPSAFA
jgi:holo-[acyl-carrier protein] synthase